MSWKNVDLAIKQLNNDIVMGQLAKCYCLSDIHAHQMSNHLAFYVAKSSEVEK
jgi:hypothetical protein